jgi:PAS domain S-box-containing protein/putative nucleotidyltransferase with HDIG domain
MQIARRSVPIRYDIAVDSLPPQSVSALLDALNCGAMLLDRSGRILHANQRLTDMLGMPSQCLSGRRFEDLYADSDDRDRVRDRLSHFDEAREGEFFLPTPGGKQRPVILSSRPLGTEVPLSDYMVVSAIDISKQKNAEARLSEEYSTISQLSDTVLAQALDLKRYSQGLEKMVQERTEEIRAANMESIYMLAVASEARDADTGAHVRRIQRYTEALSRELQLSDVEVERFGYSAILHDVGKIVVPDHVLKKPGSFTPQERDIMERHAVEGERILSETPFFATARQIARSHHENWDGSGYPDRRAGSDIPLPARIVRVADVFDALTHRRIYKAAWAPDDAAAMIRDGRGKMFDSDVAGAFESLFKRGEFRAGRARSA